MTSSSALNDLHCPLLSLSLVLLSRSSLVGFRKLTLTMFQCLNLSEDIVALSESLFCCALLMHLSLVSYRIIGILTTLQTWLFLRSSICSNQLLITSDSKLRKPFAKYSGQDMRLTFNLRGHLVSSLTFLTGPDGGVGGQSHLGHSNRGNNSKPLWYRVFRNFRLVLHRDLDMYPSYLV